MPAKLKPLSEQVIVITGASSGIGLATARAAAKAGAAVVLTSRNEAALRQICDEINAAGGRVHPVAGDVGDPQDVARIARAAIARFGGFDTWVNDAGVGAYGELTELSHEDHERLFRTNYFGVVNGSLEAIKHLRTRPGGGAVINVGAALVDAPLQVAYSASKHAVKGFTDALRLELRRARAPISVTLVKPSTVASPFAEHAKGQRPARAPLAAYAPEVAADAILHAAQHPVRQIVVGAGGRLLGAVPSPARRKGAGAGSDNLHAPGDDGAVRTGAFRGRRFSLYSETQKHPGLALGIGALAVAVAAAYLTRGAIVRRARPAVVRAVRPLVVRAAVKRPLTTARLVARRPKRAARLAAALR